MKWYEICKKNYTFLVEGLYNNDDTYLFTISEACRKMRKIGAPPLFPGFTLTELNPFIYPRGGAGSGRKHGENFQSADRPSICRINCFPFVCEFPPEFFAFPRQPE